MGQMNCVECNNPVNEQHVDFTTGIALCPVCDCAYDWSGSHGEGEAVELPDYVTMNADRTLLIIKEEKGKSATYLALFLSMAICIVETVYFDVHILGEQLSDPEKLETADIVMFLPFFVFYGFLGVGLLVLGLHRWFNYQELAVGDGDLVLRNRPLGFPKEKRFTRETTELIYAKAHNIGVRHGRPSTFEIKIREKGGKSNRLVYRVDNKRQVAYLLRFLSERLGLRRSL